MAIPLKEPDERLGYVDAIIGAPLAQASIVCGGGWNFGNSLATPLQSQAQLGT